VSEMPGQMPLFVLREPGWALLGGTPDRLWHRIESQRGDGWLTAVCGVTGRYVADREHEIICCPACVAPTETP
jgi:hypothetical protein